MAILRKIKEGFKNLKILSKKSKSDLKGVSGETKKEVLGSQEMKIEQAKFSQPEIARTRRMMPQDLPQQYGKEKLVLQVRDPWWLHAYWEVPQETFERLKYELGDSFYRAGRVLRVYDVSHIVFGGQNAHRFFDISIDEHANNWYIDTGGPGRSWCVDLGLLLPDPDGRFITIVRSNTVYTPIEGPSWITDEEWMIPDDLFARLYGMGFGFGRSSPVGKAWQERFKKALFSGVLASPVSSPVKIAAEKKFWLMVNCELILYGATAANAQVTVQGKPVTLRQDGTFTLRFALPNGKQTIPVKAVSADSVDERTITPTVTRETK